LMNIIISLLGSSLLGTGADYVTTKIALRFPELVEINPNVNFVMEFITSFLGGVGIYGLAGLVATERVARLVSLVPMGVSLGVAANNTAWIAYALRNYYPWKECPILYRE